MRLLHTTELRFEEFFDANVPPYAILSHRWGDSEVSYQDLMNGRKKDGVGYAKVLAFCKRAAADMAYYGDTFKDGKKGPFDWVWIDACCIDKSSSAELSEAINSMYSWYSRSVVCYAYLSDVEVSAERDETMKAFQGSQWFTRGWTLQELLAPHDVVFFSIDWKVIGARRWLGFNIATATGINANLVNSFRKSYYETKYVSAYEKLSWNSRRKTSRLEDQAYCLLGLFSVNMPLLYGEGQNAIRRFQLEIIRSTNDESIFAGDLDHVSSSTVGRSHISRGLLDNDAQCFRPTKRYLGISGDLDMEPVEIGRPPYTITNQGLEIRVPTKLAERDVFFWPLNCRLNQKGFSGVLAILLGVKLADPDSDPDTWYRKFYKFLPGTLPKLPAVEYEDGSFSTGVFIAPERWLWSRGQLDEMQTTLIYVKL